MLNHASTSVKPPPADKPLTLTQLQALLVIQEFIGQDLPAWRIATLIQMHHFGAHPTIRQTRTVLRQLREEGWIVREKTLVRRRVTGRMPDGRPARLHEVRCTGPNRFGISPLDPERDLKGRIRERGIYIPSTDTRGEIISDLFALVHKADQKLGVPWPRFLRLVLGLIRRLFVAGPGLILALDRLIQKLYAQTRTRQRMHDGHIRDPALWLLVCLETSLLRPGGECR